MREYLLVFLVAGVVTYLLTVVAREIALRTGAIAEVRDRDVHAEPIPYLGGLAMLGGLVAAYTVGRELPFLSTQGTFVFEDAGVVILAGAMVCGVGVLDDLFELDALTKLGGQVIAVAFLIYSQIYFLFIPTSSREQFSLQPAQGMLLTAVLVIATVNAVNFVDGLDGLAAGVVGIGASAFFLFSYQLANLNGVPLATTGAFLSAALAGACAGFLPHNFHPARLFMGDSGSMLIGLVLSASALTLTTTFSGAEIGRGGAGSDVSPLAFFLPLLLPVMILIVPIADLVLAVVRRTRAGRSPVLPGQATSPPPTAGDRPQPASRGADHVAVGGADLVRDRPRQPLHRPRRLVVARHRRRADDRADVPPPGVADTHAGAGRRRVNGPVSDAPGLCATFHKHPLHPTTGRPPPMTTALFDTRFEGHVKAPAPGFVGPPGCGSFAPSSVLDRWASPITRMSLRRSGVPLFRGDQPSTESDPGEWPMSVPMLACADVTSSGSAASSWVPLFSSRSSVSSSTTHSTPPRHSPSLAWVSASSSRAWGRGSASVPHSGAEAA